jgi:hypothetical protein
LRLPLLLLNLEIGSTSGKSSSALLELTTDDLLRLINALKEAQKVHFCVDAFFSHSLRKATKLLS